MGGPSGSGKLPPGTAVPVGGKLEQLAKKAKKLPEGAGPAPTKPLQKPAAAKQPPGVESAKPASKQFGKVAPQHTAMPEARTGQSAADIAAQQAKASKLAGKKAIPQEVGAAKKPVGSQGAAAAASQKTVQPIEKKTSFADGIKQGGAAPTNPVEQKPVPLPGKVSPPEKPGDSVKPGASPGLTGGTHVVNLGSPGLSVGRELSSYRMPDNGPGNRTMNWERVTKFTDETACNDLTGYRVEMTHVDSGTEYLIEAGNVAKLRVSGMPPGTYTFRIKAIDVPQGTESEWSLPVPTTVSGN